MNYVCHILTGYTVEIQKFILIIKNYNGTTGIPVYSTRTSIIMNLETITVQSNIDN